MKLDIQTGVQTAFFLALAGLALSFWLGIRMIRSGKKLQFFRKRRDLMVRGWRLIFFSFGLAVLALMLNRYAEPAIYKVFPPSPTVTQTATITDTPTITLTSTITPTPTITNTPSVTNTPAIPEEIATQFVSTTTPDPGAVISVVVFSKEIKDNIAVDPVEEFKNPLDTLYGTFTYDKMKAGAQWTALWYRGADLVCYETLPWDGSTGGYGLTKCQLPADQWLPGEYEVQIFVGREWMNSGRFTITGPAPTPRPTPSPTRTKAPTETVGPSPTRTSPPPTVTPRPTMTQPSTFTPTITRTPRNTDTLWPTQTPVPPTATPK